MTARCKKTYRDLWGEKHYCVKNSGHEGLHECTVAHAIWDDATSET